MEERKEGTHERTKEGSMGEKKREEENITVFLK